MKKIISLILILVMVFSLTSCGVDTSDMKIDYGKSEIYTKEDIDAAIEVILDEVNTWFAIDKIYSFSYKSHENNSDYDIVGYANELADSIGHEPNFDQAIELECDFHTANFADNEGFEPNEDYTGWSWTLARTNGGKWHLVTWGYG